MKLAECHPQRKAKARGMCGNCYQKWLVTNNPTVRRNQQENNARWVAAHPEQVAEHRKRYKRSPKGQRAQRERMLRRNYGLGIEDYERLLYEQNGGCALCFRKPGKTPHHVDHDHQTNKVRGILCHQCNWYMGTIDADPTILQRIEAYRHEQ